MMSVFILGMAPGKGGPDIPVWVVIPIAAVILTIVIYQVIARSRSGGRSDGQ